MVEGEETDFVLLICEGIVQVMARHPACIVGFRRPGEWSARWRRFTRGHGPLPCSALTDVAVVILADQWRGFLRDHHDATIALLNMVDERLDEATRKIVESDFLVEQRMPSAPLEFAEVKGEYDLGRLTEHRDAGEPGRRRIPKRSQTPLSQDDARRLPAGPAHPSPDGNAW